MKNLVQFRDLLGIQINEIKQYENLNRDRPDFDNKYLKIFYFFLNEGILSTLRKYLAHKMPQKRYLTFIITDYQNKKYINVSVQSQKNSDDFVIENKFYLCPKIDFSEISENVEDYIELFNQYAETDNYNILKIDPEQSISYDIIKDEITERFDEGLFIYGLGGYARMYIMKHFRKLKKIACIDYKSDVAVNFKKKFKFKHSFLTPSSSFALLKNVKHPVVIIATYHSDHSTLACEIFKINPNATIFIEKPITVTLDDLKKILTIINKGANLEFGFNRRFIDFSTYVKKQVKDQEVVISCSIKEVLINPNHWYLWKNQGTRITGNVVHWFDLANYWICSKPVEINLLANPNDKESSLIAVLYENGSILNITASDKGNSLRGVQEKIDIRFNNETIFINDFKSLRHIKKNGWTRKRFKFIRSKGHDVMYRNFKQIINKKKTTEYSVVELINTSVLTYYAAEMLKQGKKNKNVEMEINTFFKLV